jgi:hypothetical protein
MPNRRTHQAVGLTAGGVAAAYRARNEARGDQILEGLGGGIAGWTGGQLPDVLEPAISSYHRDIAHSWTAMYGVSKLFPALEEWEEECRLRSNHYYRLRMTSGLDPLSAVAYLIAEVLWRLAAGALSGLAAGYASHLVLDFFTPRGLPLLARQID